MNLFQTCQELVDVEGLQELDIFYYLKIHTSLKDSEIDDIILSIDFALKKFRGDNECLTQNK